MAFNESAIADFLNDFYQSRIQPNLLHEQHYTLCECQRCKLVFQQHILDNTGMELLYSHWISTEQSRRKREHAKSKLFRKYAAECETIARLVKKPPHKIRVVEFGMGWGYWCRMAMAFNFQVIGMELSPARVAHAKSLGVSAVGSFDQIENASIDFIYANQVFEHLANPLEILGQLTELLAPNGVVLLRVPDGRGIAQTLRRTGWNQQMKSIHPLEHINAFSRDSLIQMASLVGLTECRAPMRLSCHNPAQFFRSAKREFNDRFVLPHVYFKRAVH